jgi:hypothetical protein
VRSPAAGSETFAYQEGAIDWKAFDEDAIEILKRALAEGKGVSRRRKIPTLSTIRCMSLVIITVGTYIGRGLAEEKREGHTFIHAVFLMRIIN